MRGARHVFALTRGTFYHIVSRAENNLLSGCANGLRHAGGV